MAYFCPYDTEDEMAKTPLPGYLGMTKEQSDLHDQITEHERYILKFFVGATLIGSLIGALLSAAFPIHRNVYETVTKTIVTVKKTKLIADPAAVVVKVAPDSCLGGKRGFLVKIGIQNYLTPIEGNPQAETAWTYATFRDKKGTNFTCTFEGMDATKFWEADTWIVAQGGKRI